MLVVGRVDRHDRQALALLGDQQAVQRRVRLQLVEVRFVLCPKLVESFAAGDSILSPVTASDLDALPALFFSSGVWLLCWLVPATYRGVYDDAVCLRRPSKGIQSRTAVTAGSRR